MNRITPLMLLAALVAPLLLASPRADAIDIKITNNNDPAIPCRLHMGTAPGDALQLDPNGAPGDLMVRGTFSPGDPCISGGGPTPAPTGSVALPPGTVPIANTPFNVNWAAQNAVACTFTGTGWSGDACGDSQPACNPDGASGTKSVQLAAGPYDFGLTCTNGADSAEEVANLQVTVNLPSTETCGFFPNGTNPIPQRQTTGEVFFGLMPTKMFTQSLLKFESVWGFGPTCSRNASGECEIPIDILFPLLNGAQPVIKAETSKYIALRFTTAGAVALGDTAGLFKPDPSWSTPLSAIEFTISDRCGDFDPAGSPFLSQHPKCLQETYKSNPFGWTTVVSQNKCSLRNADGSLDAGKTWFLNIRAARCDDETGADMPSICRFNILNQ